MIRNHKGEDCPWHLAPLADHDLGTLQATLNCASAQGCRDCVSCSERALELFLKTARRQGGHRT